ncbi:MAG: transglutaminase family protein [Roseovarius sp.]|uniref:transglutaminase family protein n=1 Tax=Roseovarius sp. TaxID=1486281 RepID=UPI0019C674B0|nr:transglutaminase family protein [Roseovarius sp.]MBC7180882.1 transglutaminase family protein [Roseovarius sp.]MBQ0749051.1 transglutaminase family protein [Roseovarius sp.]MBQ0809143.1 transglutaminase family protein [Roseovarius sp.]
MHLAIKHLTHYTYSAPVPYGVQQLRLYPKPTRGQRLVTWSVTVEGATKQAEFTDHHRNHVVMFSFDPDVTELIIRSEGVVEMTDTAGIVGPHEGMAPLWLFQRPTEHTRAGKGCREILRSVEGDSDLARLHDLSARVHAAIAYETGKSEIAWTAEDALAAGHGVCQDHAHVFIACARAMGLPARYVSGYLRMDGQDEQSATHAWAEAHVEGLGWVGFDVSNAISPDTRYVRVATGLDYTEAAPISGHRYGMATENMDVTLQVTQQQ